MMARNIKQNVLDRLEGLFRDAMADAATVAAFEAVLTAHVQASPLTPAERQWLNQRYQAIRAEIPGIVGAAVGLRLADEIRATAHPDE